MSAQHTQGPWYWHTDFQGRVSLRTPDRGQLIVMQFVRQGMQGATPRFSHWKGLEAGEPRGRQGGIMKVGIDHPDARLIEAAPLLHNELVCTMDALRKGAPECIDYGEQTQQAFAHGWRAALDMVFAEMSAARALLSRLDEEFEK